jgi:hypothetical protein
MLNWTLKTSFLFLEQLYIRNSSRTWALQCFTELNPAGRQDAF